MNYLDDWGISDKFHRFIYFSTPFRDFAEHLSETKTRPAAYRLHTTSFGRTIDVNKMPNQCTVRRSNNTWAWRQSWPSETCFHGSTAYPRCYERGVFYERTSAYKKQVSPEEDFIHFAKKTIFALRICNAHVHTLTHSKCKRQAKRSSLREHRYNLISNIVILVCLVE